MKNTHVTELIGLDPEIPINAMTHGFWHKASETFLNPNELERFKWKNSCNYDEEHDLLFQPGADGDHDNVIVAKPSLCVTSARGCREYFLHTPTGCYFLKDFKKSWALKKEDLINQN